MEASTHLPYNEEHRVFSRIYPIAATTFPGKDHRGVIQRVLSFADTALDRYSSLATAGLALHQSRCFYVCAVCSCVYGFQKMTQLRAHTSGIIKHYYLFLYDIARWQAIPASVQCIELSYRVIDVHPVG